MNPSDHGALPMDQDAESTSLLVSSEQATLAPEGGAKRVQPMRVVGVVAILTCLLAFALLHSAQPKPSNLHDVVSLDEKSRESGQFCNTPYMHGIKAKDLASTAVCQSVCPCCKGKPLPHSDCTADEDTPVDADKSLQQKWELDDALPRQLLIKTGAEFLKTFWKSPIKTHSWKEVLNHTMYQISPSQVEQMVQQWSEIQTQKGWSDPEMAMFGYTVNVFYGPVNKMLREAKSTADIDDWTQSYIALLKDGLENNAKYVDVQTYRGMKNCDGAQFHPGTKGILPQFTSTSTAKRVALSWASPCNDHNPLVVYFTGGGYDISKYSFYPKEQELLLEPGREFVVGSVENITCVHPRTKKKMTYTVVHRLTDGPTQLKEPKGVSRKESPYTCPKEHLKSCDVCRCCSIPESLENA